MTDIVPHCRVWWQQLTNPNIGRSRAAWAQLRRASAPIDALMLPIVHDLHRRLMRDGHDLRHHPETLALIAMVLAQVKTDTKATLALRMGQGEQPALSAMRFDRLMRTDDPGSLTQQMRRALALVGHGANVGALARDLYWWNDATRARWCFEYYGAPDAAPEELTEESQA